eukprot:scaffold3949_cov229-Pinguiococcus_pyrenoidosus.AAC.4
MLGSVVGLSRAVGGEEQQSLALLRLDFQGLAVQAQVLEHRAAAVLDVVEVHQQGRDALPAVGEVCGQQLLRQRVAVPAELLPEAVSHHLRLLHLRQPDFRHQAQRLFHERLAVAEVQEPRRRRPVTSRVRGERLGRHFIPWATRCVSDPLPCPLTPIHPKVTDGGSASFREDTAPANAPFPSDAAALSASQAAPSKNPSIVTTGGSKHCSCTASLPKASTATFTNSLSSKRRACCARSLSPAVGGTTTGAADASSWSGNWSESRGEVETLEVVPSAAAADSLEGALCLFLARLAKDLLKACPLCRENRELVPKTGGNEAEAEMDRDKRGRKPTESAPKITNSVSKRERSILAASCEPCAARRSQVASRVHVQTPKKRDLG